MTPKPPTSIQLPVRYDNASKSIIDDRGEQIALIVRTEPVHTKGQFIAEAINECEGEKDEKTR